jgi:16S rRNA (cytosine967-C5)-methyltransferase
MVKPGGEMVYSTCSIFPSEGEQQVANFLNNHPQWTLLEQKRSGFPFSLGDGFFMARLKKNNS